MKGSVLYLLICFGFTGTYVLSRMSLNQNIQGAAYPEVFIVILGVCALVFGVSALILQKFEDLEEKMEEKMEEKIKNFEKKMEKMAETEKRTRFVS